MSNLENNNFKSATTWYVPTAKTWSALLASFFTFDYGELVSITINIMINPININDCTAVWQCAVPDWRGMVRRPASRQAS